jgi:hypothetical protein
MSGGRWNYQEYKILDAAEETKKLLVFADAVARSEHIVDWAESGDTVRRCEDGSGAERDLYDLWLKTFDDVYGDWL